MRIGVVIRVVLLPVTVGSQRVFTAARRTIEAKIGTKLGYRSGFRNVLLSHHTPRLALKATERIKWILKTFSLFNDVEILLIYERERESDI